MLTVGANIHSLAVRARTLAATNFLDYLAHYAADELFAYLHQIGFLYVWFISRLRHEPRLICATENLCVGATLPRAGGSGYQARGGLE